MDMLETMRFVRGAVSTKDLVPEMKYFAIEGGVIRAYNGMIALASPIDFAVDCKPQALPLVSAIGNCEDVMSLGMTPSGRLRVESGAFRAYIDCIEGESPHLLPAGEVVEIDGTALMDAIKVLSPFIGNDASRIWTNGIMLRGQSAFATNNVCLVEYWLGVDIPITVNIPQAAVKEMARVKEPPISAQMTEHSITFHYSNGRWIRTQLFSTEWPDLSEVLGGAADLRPMPTELFEGLEKIKPFINKQGIVYFRDGKVQTEQVEGLGASYNVEGLHSEGVYKLIMLALLDGVATHIDFSSYPSPSLFQGERVRGAIIGLSH